MFYSITSVEMKTGGGLGEDFCGKGLTMRIPYECLHSLPIVSMIKCGRCFECEHFANSFALYFWSHSGE